MQICGKLRGTIEQLNSLDKQRIAETHRFMEEQKIKKGLGPELWEKLAAKIGEFCAAIGESSPADLTCSAEGIYVLSITNIKNGRSAKLEYNRDVPCIFYKTPSGSGHLAFRVSADGNSVDLTLDDIPKSLDELASFFTRSVIR